MFSEGTMPESYHEDFVQDRLFKREERRKDADQRKTYDEVFDHRTLKTLYKFMVDGVFETLDFPVSTGKEGNVFRATTRDGTFLAVKIYRTSTSTFKHILRYIEGDPRFRGIAGNRRRLLSAWAQKEFRNLRRMHDAGVSVPAPVEQRDNVIVMEFLGENGLPYPLLKDVDVNDYAACLDAIIGDVRRTHDDAGLVHGDLSEYNMLYSGRHHVIDVGQGVLLTHPMAGEMKERDTENLLRFFNRKGVDIGREELYDRMYGT